MADESFWFKKKSGDENAKKTLKEIRSDGRYSLKPKTFGDRGTAERAAEMRYEVNKARKEAMDNLPSKGKSGRAAGLGLGGSKKGSSGGTQVASRPGRANSTDGKVAMAKGSPSTFAKKASPKSTEAAAATPKAKPPGNFSQGADLAEPKMTVKTSKVPIPRQKPKKLAKKSPQKVVRVGKSAKSSNFKGNWKGAAPSKDGIAGKKGAARLKALAQRAQEER